MRYAVEIVATSSTHQLYAEQEVSAASANAAEQQVLNIFHHGSSTDDLLNWEDVDIVSIKPV